MSIPVHVDNPLEPVTTPLTPRQRKGLARLGDVVIPGDDRCPSFSESGADAGIDDMLPYMHEADRRSLLSLLQVCAVLPAPMIRVLVATSSAADKAPAPLAALLRLANIGIKGVVHSLYWSDLGHGRVHERIGYLARIDEDAYEQSLNERSSQ